MSTTFTWAIANLERETSDGYVFTSHYTISANDGTYSSGAYGSVGFQRPESLIPFDDLTEELVIAWTKEAIGGDEKVAEIVRMLFHYLGDELFYRGVDLYLRQWDGKAATIENFIAALSEAGQKNLDQFFKFVY